MESTGVDVGGIHITANARHGICCMYSYLSCSSCLTVPLAGTRPALGRDVIASLGVRDT